MAKLKRDYYTDYDLTDPELSARWDEIVADLHTGCPVASRPYIRCERFQIAHGEPLIPPGLRCASSELLSLKQRVR